MDAVDRRLNAYGLMSTRNVKVHSRLCIMEVNTSRFDSTFSWFTKPSIFSMGPISFQDFFSFLCLALFIMSPRKSLLNDLYRSVLKARPTIGREATNFIWRYLSALGVKTIANHRNHSSPSWVEKIFGYKVIIEIKWYRHVRPQWGSDPFQILAVDEWVRWQLVGQLNNAGVVLMWRNSSILLETLVRV